MTAPAHALPAVALTSERRREQRELGYAFIGRFHITAGDRKAVVLAEGCRVELPLGQLPFLLRLVRELHSTAEGWVAIDGLAEAEWFSQRGPQAAISRLRAPFGRSIQDPETGETIKATLLIKQSSSRLRLSVPPEMVTFDRTALRSLNEYSVTRELDLIPDQASRSR